MSAFCSGCVSVCECAIVPKGALKGFLMSMASHFIDAFLYSQLSSSVSIILNIEPRLSPVETSSGRSGDSMCGLNPLSLSSMPDDEEHGNSMSMREFCRDRSGC